MYSIADLYEFVNKLDEEFAPALEVSGLTFNENKKSESLTLQLRMRSFNPKKSLAAHFVAFPFVLHRKTAKEEFQNKKASTAPHLGIKDAY